MSICRAHKRTQPKYNCNASNALRVPTAPQTHESLCCSEAVDIQDDERLQRCCGTASWRQLAESWKRLIFNQVQCHLWKRLTVWLAFSNVDIVDENTDGLATSIAVLTARAGLTSCLFQARTVAQFVLAPLSFLALSAWRLRKLSVRWLASPGQRAVKRGCECVCVCY